MQKDNAQVIYDRRVHSSLSKNLVKRDIFYFRVSVPLRMTA